MDVDVIRVVDACSGEVFGFEGSVRNRVVCNGSFEVAGSKGSVVVDVVWTGFLVVVNSRDDVGTVEVVVSVEEVISGDLDRTVVSIDSVDVVADMADVESVCNVVCI